MEIVADVVAVVSSFRCSRLSLVASRTAGFSPFSSCLGFRVITGGDVPVGVSRFLLSDERVRPAAAFLLANNFPLSVSCSCLIGGAGPALGFEGPAVLLFVLITSGLEVGVDLGIEVPISCVFRLTAGGLSSGDDKMGLLPASGGGVGVTLLCFDVILHWEEDVSVAEIAVLLPAASR